VDSLGRATAWLGMRFGAAEMTFRYADSFQAADTPGGYQRLLLDAMVGDQSLFTSDAAIERLWEISAPLLDNPPPMQPLHPRFLGPAASIRPPHRALPLAPATMTAATRAGSGV